MPHTPERTMNCQQRISNRCPACGNQTLFIAEGGWLTCSWLKCPNPCAIGDIAEDYRAKEITARRSQEGR